MVSTFCFSSGTATTVFYTLSLHDALPISWHRHEDLAARRLLADRLDDRPGGAGLHAESTRRSALLVVRASRWNDRSEEHTSELQSQSNLVCRLLLEKKKSKMYIPPVACRT